MDDLALLEELRFGSSASSSQIDAEVGWEERRAAGPIRRRAGLALAVSCAWWPRLLVAQPRRAVRIGLLLPSQQQVRANELLERLDPLGWKRRDNFEVEQRVADTPQALEKYAAELVTLRVDVIVAFLTPAVLAARQASSTIPIVMAGAAVDPVSAGLARSLSAPGGNVTGIVIPGTHLASKALELMGELRRPTRRVGVLANGADPFTPALLETLADAARVLGIGLSTTTVRSRDEYSAAFSAWRASGTDAVFVQPSLATDHAAATALWYRLASFSFVRVFASSGGLLSYAANTSDLSRRAADYVDRILRGTEPAQLPIEQAASYELTLNLRTARTLGISVPKLLMLRATELIQ
ncbi:MAG TPA: ABC transporter substrate-binding protein [Steroidobacteraceae bacterium]|nr:ABC transporter substrate-binding protein [Steroidobacteraceae bacterium]